MKIRLAQNDDYVQIAAIRENTIRTVNSKDYSQDVIEDWVSQNNAEKLRKNAHKYKRWVALEDKKIIGFCDHNFNCELTRLYVDQNHLGKGVGSALMLVAEESLAKEGCKLIKVKSSITAQSFYEKHKYSTVKKSIEESVEIYLMEKQLFDRG